MNQEKTKASTVCANCGGQLEIDATQETIECPYCGTDYSVSDLLNDSDAVRIEKIKQQTYKEIEADKIKREIEKEKTQEEKEKIQSFKKSKFSKFLLACAIISGLTTIAQLSNGISMAGIIALIQTILYTTSWLMGRGIIKEKKPNMKNILAIISFALIIPFFMLFGGSYGGSYGGNHKKKIDWDSIVLSEQLPEPKSNKGEIITNSDESLCVYIANSSLNDYNNYINKCKEYGFVIDADNSTSSYEAYDDEGYKLRIYYSKSSKKFQIDLKAPLKMKKIQWPTSNVVSKLPAPKSQVGKVDYDHDNSFAIYVGDTTKADYDEYVNSCISAGFSIDYSKNEKTYWGDNSEGYHISVEYKGNDTMYISIKAPDDEEIKSKKTNAESENENANETNAESENENGNETKAKDESSSGVISPDFKAAMDSYEKFFDEYVAIMKKYANNPNDMSILADYTKYIGKYAQMMEDFEKWEDEDMNVAETAYYLEVQGRITKKLLEVAQ